MEGIELQLGSVHSINTDGTLNIRDFKTGGLLYRNVDIEHAASNVQQPVPGQHVLFMTVPSAAGSSKIVKTIKFYGSKKADTDLVRSSPVDLAPGEHRVVSQNGNTVYVANGAIYLSGLGQSILLLDDPGILKLTTTNFQLVHRDGTLIQEKDGKLVISKGAISQATGGAESQIKNPDLSITIDKNNITISGTKTVVNVDCKEVNLGPSAANAVILGPVFKELYNAHTHPSGVGPTGMPAIPMTDKELSQRVKVST
jgi:hypothetical protein